MIKARTFEQVSAERMKTEPTPETDACIAAVRGQSLERLCRRLERERNKAEAGWSECRDFAQRIVDERDALRKALDMVMGWAPQAPDYFNDKTKARWDDDMQKALKVLEITK